MPSGITQGCGLGVVFQQPARECLRRIIAQEDSPMAPYNGDSNQSHSGCSDRSPLQDRMLAIPNAAVSRRDFLGMTAGSLMMAGMLSGAAKPDSKNGSPSPPLGRTGEQVSLIGLGGYHLGKQSDPEESVRIIRTGIEEGINFFDNCWDYNGGESTIRIGLAL